MNKFLNTKAVHIATRFSDVMGPIILSALSLFISFWFLQPLALWLDSSFSLLANRGVGKIAFTMLVLLHIILLLATTSKKLLTDFLTTNLYFIKYTSWLAPFFFYFFIFFTLHGLMLVVFWVINIVYFHPEAVSLISSKLGNLALAFIATFFLAWTEEAIFRGALFTVLRQKLAPLTCIIITSIIFSLAHDLTNPLSLVTTDWKLGLGLFLLGMLLNLLFFLSNKLYTSMGAHAGLVFMKVLLRRIPFISYAPILPWWFDVDLRQSLLTHALFLCIITVLIIIFRSRFRENI